MTEYSEFLRIMGYLLSLLIILQLSVFGRDSNSRGRIRLQFTFHLARKVVDLVLWQNPPFEHLVHW